MTGTRQALGSGLLPEVEFFKMSFLVADCEWYSLDKGNPGTGKRKCTVQGLVRLFFAQNTRDVRFFPAIRLPLV